MNTYEVMYILSPDLDEEGIEAAVTKFADLITAQNGEVVRLERMGRRRLAYEIKKQTEGFYVLIDFKGSSEVAQELDRVMKITDSVIRYMILRKDG
jgi:small subunit ribosomal protein S6